MTRRPTTPTPTTDPPEAPAPDATAPPADAPAPDAPVRRKRRAAVRRAPASASDGRRKHSAFPGAELLAAVEGIIALGAEIGVKSITINLETGTFEVVAATSYSTRS